MLKWLAILLVFLFLVSLLVFFMPKNKTKKDEFRDIKIIEEEE